MTSTSKLWLALALATLPYGYAAAQSTVEAPPGSGVRVPKVCLTDPATGLCYVAGGGGGGSSTPVGTASDATDGQATAQDNQKTLARAYVFNGSTWDRLRGTNGAANVLEAALEAVTGTTGDAAYTGTGNATIDALLKGVYARLAGTLVTNLAQVNGGTVATGTGASNSQTQRVVLSSDSPMAATGSVGAPGTNGAQAQTFQGVDGGKPVIVGGQGAVISASFQRPQNTTAYALGQLVANSTAGGSVTPMQFTVVRKNGGTARISRVCIAKSSTSTTNAAFRIHLYSAAPTASNGDGAAWLTSGALTYVGAFDVVVDKAFTDGAKGCGVISDGSAYITFAAGTSSQALYALNEARAGYAPASQETFTDFVETDGD